MRQKRRSVFYFPLIIAFCSLLGGLYGPRVEVASAANEDDLKNTIKAFTRIYSVVEENFADKVSPDKTVFKGAIPGMLRTLDPHSNFFDPRDFQVLREDQKGHYFGVGMHVAERNRKTIVIAPFPGSPAYRAGLRPGDVILVVNDKPTDNLNVTEVADLLKGPRGTPVQIVVSREGSDKPLTFNVIRDEISRKSVEDALWIRPGIAYLDIQQFNETTSPELEENLKRLGEANIKGLILDLRNNPGGLLNEGVAVADRFLRKDQTIVSHRGRASAEKPYVARRGNRGHEYPIIVLVDRYSASAAEIVAGALQDHDRAWILGENTFGKGLVQTVFPLNDNTGLALTTAKYYTPSGRLIQRDYSHTSFLDYYNHKDLETKNPLDVKMTDSGRTVYGGGGISPDEKYSTPKANKFQIQLSSKAAFFNFTKRYFGTHEAKLPANWAPDIAIMNDFHAYLLKEGFNFTEAEFAENVDWMKRFLRREMYVTAFNVDEARRIMVETDPVIEKAIDSLSKAKALLENAKKMIAQRTSK
ncbi:MAG: S41 family peptidase [Candidatus Solibacter usitatus]|nr:S41 family peptidase [Candidatus Solibacter usitatus]